LLLKKIGVMDRFAQAKAVASTHAEQEPE